MTARASDAPGRIAHLDGLRGLAIAVVFGYHAYARWTSIVPYGNALENVPIFRFGLHGVELFYLISGYVIFMTLERCRDFGEFVYKRWLRLFPAMLVCSALIFLTAPYLPERPKGLPVLRDLLPGLTFVDPRWWTVLLGSLQGQLEGSFGTLYVEFKFYVLAGLLFFRVGPLGTVAVLAPLGFLSKVLSYYVIDGIASPSLVMLRDVLRTFGLFNFGWFCAGACFYLYGKTGTRAWLVGGIGLGIAFAVDGHIGQSCALLVVLLVFVSALTSPHVQRLLCLRPLLWLGVASYPLYLMHEQALIALLVKFSGPPLNINSVWVPPLILLAFASLAYLIAVRVEPVIKRLITAGLRQSSKQPSALYR